ncbi:unnamed protein product [Microthlaspi erraticum]|uniref:Uncharacterized protein n=1 Tax=Microthlaspi erraticum TaxID=1685480 RepID=A0A6D2JL49_9BRAS|nr:unnamed protein product [Microthlaspi erraticum]
MGREEQGRTWCMDAAQLDTQRKKEEAILKTSSTTYSTTGRVPQLDRPSFNSIELRSQSQTRKMCMRTRSSRTTEDLVELDFTTGRKRSQRTQRVLKRNQRGMETLWAMDSVELGKLDRLVFWSILEHMGQGAWRDLAHGSSSTGYAKEEGRSHLEDQLDRLLDQPVEFLNSTGQASTRSS